MAALGLVLWTIGLDTSGASYSIHGIIRVRSSWSRRSGTGYGLPTVQFAAVAFYVDLLAEQGSLLGEPYTRQLDGKLRELRFHLERAAVRVTY